MGIKEGLKEGVIFIATSAIWGCVCALTIWIVTVGTVAGKVADLIEAALDK